MENEFEGGCCVICQPSLLFSLRDRRPPCISLCPVPHNQYSVDHVAATTHTAQGFDLRCPTTSKALLVKKPSPLGLRLC